MRLILNEYFQELSKQKEDNKELKKKKKIRRLGKKKSKQDDITKIQCCLH